VELGKNDAWFLARHSRKKATAPVAAVIGDGLALSNG
jgi:hypothetical protein